MGVEPGVIAALAAAISALLGALAASVRAGAKIRESAAAMEIGRQQWEQDTIDRQRQAMADLMAQREGVLNGHIADLTGIVQEQRQRLDYFEQEVATLRADRVRDQEQIGKLTERVHKLEMENAVLLTQREARDAQIELLGQELAAMREQGTALFRLVAEVGALVKIATGPGGVPGPDNEPPERAA